MILKFVELVVELASQQQRMFPAGGAGWCVLFSYALWMAENERTSAKLELEFAVKLVPMFVARFVFDEHRIPSLALASSSSPRKNVSRG